ncbi:ATP-binding cassette domain-containing protein [Paenibacillaceae bacterium WGS1546]|uniref:ATP-binding cassette domain-containing protein n=1 Tax=Cohnella sp. WGS1546 TaxID=3366810 RepID=UPI00372D802A
MHKSTLGRLICRLTDATAGTIVFDGQDITHFKKWQLRPIYRKMQVVFQDSASSLNPRRPVGEQIVLPMLRLGIYENRDVARQQAVSLLKRVGLGAEHYYRYSHEYNNRG